MAYHVVLVGADGSQSAYRAVDRAADVALGVGAMLVVAFAYPPTPQRGGSAAAGVLGDEVYTVAGSHPARDVLADAAARAQIVGLDPARITTVPAPGDPVAVLVTLATERRADLLVVGDRGRGNLTDRLLGSVPTNIVRKVSCDVLIVRTGARGR